MGSRAAHNWKRRQKLLEKYGKGTGKGKDQKTGGKRWDEDRAGRSRAPAAGTKRGRTASGSWEAREAKQTKKVLKKGKVRVKACVKKVRRKSEQAEGKLKRDPKTGNLKRLKKVPGKRAKLLAEGKGKKVQKKHAKQTARVLCPGSLTERFIACGRASAYSALTAFERRLLSTGQLSWRWLRDQDEDLIPQSARPVEADPEGHSQAMWHAEGSLPLKAVSRLRAVDAALEGEALWPPCADRLKLAQRLQYQKGLRRRSERYMREVIAPLLDQHGLSVAWTEASSRAALAQAASLLCGCASSWMEVGAESSTSPDFAKKAWSQMLRRSLSVTLEEDIKMTPEWRSWLFALRQVQLARLCQQPDSDARLRLLRSVSLAAPSMEVPKEASAPVVLPLGLFTFWQVLLLTVLARREGLHAMVVRRQAAGTPEVIFRTSSVVLTSG